MAYRTDGSVHDVTGIRKRNVEMRQRGYLTALQ